MKTLDLEVLCKDRAIFGFRESYKAGLERTKRSVAG